MVRLSAFARPFLLFILLVLNAYAAEAGYDWTAYTSSEQINAMTIAGDRIWCATDGGVVCWNTNDMSYEKFTVSDGLGANIVQAITRGPEGTIYAGTNGGGLASFDGASWYTLYEEECHYSSIVSLCVSPAGDLWAGAEGGNFIGDARELHLNEQLGEHTKRDATCMVAASDSSMWLGAYGAIIRNKGDEIDTYYTNLEKNYQVVAVACAPNGDVWISHRKEGDFGWTDSKISWFDGSEWTTYTKYSGVANLDVNVNSIAVAPDGTVWFGCDSGIMRYDGTSFTKYLTDGDVVLSSVKGIGIDDHGDVWAGGRGGLVRFDAVTTTMYTTSNEPAGNKVCDIAVDADGVVWVGTHGKGVSRFDGSSWTTYTQEDGVGSNYILAVDISPVTDDVWVASYSRISSFSGGVWKMFQIESDGFDSTVTDIAVDRRGVVWVSSRSGVYSFDNGEWTDYTDNKEGISFDYARCVYESRDGAVWVSTDTGFYRYIDGNWEILGESGFINVMASDSEGGVYVGGSSVGKYDGSRSYFNNYMVSALTVDTNDVLWVGIDRLGLFRWEGEGWEQQMPLSLQHSVFDRSLAAAPDGSVWMGTYGMGVFRISESVVHADEENVQPLARLLLRNYPNPFNPSTSVEFSLPSAGYAEVSVFNALGQKVRVLASGKMTAGAHSIRWDGCDDGGNSVASGIYLSRLTMGSRATAHRMLMMK